MVSVFMISRRRLATLVLAPAVLFLIETACNRVPLLAPSGSSITLATATSVLPINGTATIIAQVIESAGTPPQAGTHVTFTTSLGTIEPAEASTDSSGQVRVTFTASSSGTATITAISGGATVGASGALKILVGTAAVQKVIVNATPTTIPAIGGSSTVSAVAIDVNGNQMAGIPVTFTTNGGTLSLGIAPTDATGTARTVLTTAVTAKVTVSIGAATTATSGTTSTTTSVTGDVTVTVSAAPTLVITPVSTTPAIGAPASFTFKVGAATGVAVKNLTVDWGDGSQVQDLGGSAGDVVVSHVFGGGGPFTVKATLTDAVGNTVTASTVVTPVALNVNVTALVGALSAGNYPVTFTATVTPNTVSVTNYAWSFGDAGPTTRDTTGNSTVFTYAAGSGARTVTVTVTPSGGKSSTTFIVP